MRYILYQPEAKERYHENGRWVAPHPALAVFRETKSPDEKKEILNYHGKKKGYSLLTFRTWKEASYFNSGIMLLKGIRFQIREWSKKDGLGAEIVIIPKEVFYGQQSEGSDWEINDVRIP